jgi:hypothetical protein
MYINPPWRTGCPNCTCPTCGQPRHPYWQQPYWTSNTTWTSGTVTLCNKADEKVAVSSTEGEGLEGDE